MVRVVLKGQDDSTTIIDGEGHRIFEVKGGELSMEKMTVMNGAAPTSSTSCLTATQPDDLYQCSGGCIYSNGGSVELIETSIFNCNATIGMGGAIYMDGERAILVYPGSDANKGPLSQSLTITDSEISDCYALSGARISRTPRRAVPLFFMPPPT